MQLSGRAGLKPKGEGEEERREGRRGRRKEDGVEGNFGLLGGMNE